MLLKRRICLYNAKALLDRVFDVTRAGLSLVVLDLQKAAYFKGKEVRVVAGATVCHMLHTFFLLNSFFKL